MTDTLPASPTVTVATRADRRLFALAALSFLPTLFFYAVGEEGISAISALETWQSGQWLARPLFGHVLQHPPLYNWLIAPLAAAVGWEHMFVAVRMVSVAASLATAALAGWLTQRLTGERPLGWLAALVYLTFFDVLFYRGWLGYGDPLFAFFVFGAIATAWLAASEARPGWLVPSVLLLSCAFLTKALTAYVFYFAALAVLAWDAKRRRVLCLPISIAIVLGSLAVPLLWFGVVSPHRSQGGAMLSDVIAKLSPQGIGAYLGQVIVFPLKTLFRLLPAGVLAFYLMARHRTKLLGERRAIALAAFAIALVNGLPYWFAPQSHTRYLLPVFPLFAIGVAVAIASADAPAQRTVRRWLAAAIALKFLFALVLFPVYQIKYRGQNYADAARAIMARTAGHPLYTLNDTAAGLNVVGYIDSLWRPRDPVKWAPAEWSDGFVIAEEADPAVGQLAERFKLGGDELFVLCRGAACAAYGRAR